MDDKRRFMWSSGDIQIKKSKDKKASNKKPKNARGQKKDNGKEES